MGLGEEDHRDNVPFSSHISKLRTVNMINPSNVNLDLHAISQSIFTFVTSCDPLTDHDIQGWHCQLHFMKVDPEMGAGTKAL